ncbi:hypothetical protein [Paraburkholderia phenazinium]|uniref:Type III secretion regulatory protein HpaA n=1 Tax=Paraburkholderia phenazinium TaxID=60549 RepID=A0A1G8K9A1_9BURK|nr:hypothetical protein [Paraburkholderia phenazinium]SDI40001.1 hypothetical protein SAMN05216466_12235 [Paraburkholderia phenazinium]
MSLSRVNGSHVPSDNGTASQSTSEAAATPGHHRHHEQVKTHKSGNRPRTKRRRGADSQDGVDESGASEELLQMLEEHLQRNAELVMRAGERRGGEQGNSGGGQQDEDERGAASSAGLSRSGRRTASGNAAASDADEAHRRAEQELFIARRAQAEERPPASSTYAVLATMREFLTLPGAAAHTPPKLVDIRSRLIEAMGTPVSRAPARQHSINLLLPLMLLNLERVRTDGERALALARLNSLLGRRRAGV